MGFSRTLIVVHETHIINHNRRPKKNTDIMAGDSALITRWLRAASVRQEIFLLCLSSGTLLHDDHAGLALPVFRFNRFSTCLPSTT